MHTGQYYSSMLLSLKNEYSGTLFSPAASYWYGIAPQLMHEGEVYNKGDMKFPTNSKTYRVNDSCVDGSTERIHISY